MMLSCLCVLLPLPPLLRVLPAYLPQDSELTKLIAKVATKDGIEADEAADKIIERFIGPISDAIGSVESRPAEEQRRIRQLLNRLMANLRLRLLLADLPPDDRKLLVEFVRFNPQLVEQLFDDNPTRRRLAVGQIPLEPDTGAGVLVVAKINDSDELVVTEAFNAAAALGDKVVARGLSRFLNEVVAALQADAYSPGEQEIALGLAARAGEAVKHLGEMKSQAAVPAIAAAIKFFPKSRYRLLFLTASVSRAEENSVLAALGKLGDPRGAEALLELIDDKELWGNKAIGNGKLLTQTIGDGALLSLCRMFNKDPREFGFQMNSESGLSAGFTEDSARDESRVKFLTWYRAHAANPATSRPAATSESGG